MFSVYMVPSFMQDEAIAEKLNTACDEHIEQK
jgi:hypothetical protein